MFKTLPIKSILGWEKVDLW